MEIYDREDLEKKEIGKRVKIARKKQGYSQSQLARKTCISLDTIKNIETGRTELKLDEAIDISKTCNASLDYLYGLSEFMNEEEFLIENLIEKIFSAKLFQKKYMDRHLTPITVDTIQLTMNDYLVQYLLKLVNLNEEKTKNKMSYDVYNEKREDLKQEYYNNLSKNDNKKTNHILMPKALISDDMEERDYIFNIIDKVIKENFPK